MKLLEQTGAEKRRLVHGFEEDFYHYVTAHRWTSVLTDSGTNSVGDAAGGVLDMVPSDGTVADNDEAYIKTTAEVFKFVNAKPLACEAYLAWTEANTDDANVFVGFMNAIAANSLQDNGAGPPSNYSGAVFFKADGDTVWSAEVSDGTTQWTKKLDADGSLDGIAKTCGAGTYQELRIEVVPTSSTKMDVCFFIDGVLVWKKKDATYASATEMQFGAGVKNGGSNNENLKIDRAEAWQKR